jgi:hypothetical protein
MGYYFGDRAPHAAGHVHPTFQENYMKTLTLDALCDGRNKM